MDTNMKLSDKPGSKKVNTSSGKNLTELGKNNSSSSATCLFNILVDNHISYQNKSAIGVDDSTDDTSASDNPTASKTANEKISIIKNLGKQILDILNSGKKSGVLEDADIAALLEKLEKIMSLKTDELDILSIAEISEIIHSELVNIEPSNPLAQTKLQDSLDNLAQIRNLTSNTIAELTAVLTELLGLDNKATLPENSANKNLTQIETTQHLPASKEEFANNYKNDPAHTQRVAENIQNNKLPAAVLTELLGLDNKATLSENSANKNLPQIETTQHLPTTKEEFVNNYKNDPAHTQKVAAGISKYEIEKALKKIEALLEKISSTGETKSPSNELSKLLEEKAKIISSNLEKISAKNKDIENSGTNYIKNSVKEVSAQFLQEIRNILDKYGMKFDSNNTSEEKSMQDQLAYKNKKEQVLEIKPTGFDLTAQKLQEHKPTKESVEIFSENKPIEKPEQNQIISKDIGFLKGVEQKELVSKGKIFEQLEKNIFKTVTNAKGDLQVKQFMLNLEPKELGSVKVMLEFSKNEMRAAIRVENEEVKTVIRENLPKLKEALQISGVSVAEMYVDVNDKNSNFFKEFAKKSNLKSLSTRKESYVLDSDDVTPNNKKLFTDSKYEIIV